MKKNITTAIYFLENHCELKIVCKTVPHHQIFILNDNGKVKISLESKVKKQSKKRIKKKDHLS